MARVQEIAIQIRSLKELSGVIAAIRVMATSQMQQGEQALDAVRNYTEIIRHAFAEAAVLVPEEREDAARQGPSRPCLVVFCSEHGFCGAFNEPLIRAAATALHQEPNLRLLFVGSRGTLRAAEHGVRPYLTLTMATHIGGIGAAARRVAAELYRMFIAQTITSAEMLYMRETTANTTSLERLTLLPFETPPMATHQATALPLVNMQPRRLRDELAAEYMFAMLEGAAMESFTSENAVRFHTMQAAHENIDRKSAGTEPLGAPAASGGRHCLDPGTDRRRRSTQAEIKPRPTIYLDVERSQQPGGGVRCAGYRGVRQALFQNAYRHAAVAAVHRLAEFSEESCDQPRSLNALSSFMKRRVRLFTP